MEEHSELEAPDCHKVKFHTAIRIEPMLSTIEIPDTYLGGANGLVQYKMEVRLHGKMTAYCDDMDLRLLDIKKSTKKELTASSKREISQWLRDAFASGQIEIEVVNDGFNLYGMTDDGNVYTRR